MAATNRRAAGPPLDDEAVRADVIGWFEETASGRAVTYADGDPVLRVGERVAEVLVGTSGTVRVSGPGLAEIALPAPLVVDRWMTDASGHSRFDLIAADQVTGFAIDPTDRARLLGSVPLLRRRSVTHRHAVLGRRDHLPQSSRSSM